MQQSKLVIGIVAALAVSVGLVVSQAKSQQSATPPLAPSGGVLQSVSYSPFAVDEHPLSHRPSVERIRSDLRLLRPYTHTVRTYSSTNGLESVVPVAAELGINVKLGLWIGDNDEANEREIKAGLSLARRYSNVVSLVVGNETTLVAPDPSVVVRRMVEILNRVRPLSPVPITTAEFWHIWLAHPELAAASDFLAVHILPFWEGIPVTDATGFALERFRQLQQKYPGRRIVIGEFGWPSQGGIHKGAQAGESKQAAVMREFITRAHALGIEYNIIEAFDQPWKTHEGPVGPHWGLFTVDREPKPAMAAWLSALRPGY